MIDLRSDTVTRPTPAMREAMANAEVGDDVLGDDPTIAALEARTAEVLGMDAAVYMPSGTMTNQVAIRCHTQPGDEILLHRESHIYFYEGGAPAALSGVMCNLLEGDRGLFTANTLTRAIRPANVHHPKPALVCIENTHNRGGGSIWPMPQLADVAAAARERGLAMHLDGARMWNAAIAQGVSEADIASHFDSVSVCFSKGLGAPVGSALAGSADFIERARRFRKQFGGGMRQVGIIAAGALHALEHHRARLADDHANARRLAEGLSAMPQVTIDLASVETNIVAFDTPGIDAMPIQDRLGEAGVALFAIGPYRYRACTHLNVTADEIETAIEVIGNTLAS